MSGCVDATALRGGGVFHDVERLNHFLETFLVSSWAEHQRQHERQTQADHKLEQRLRGHVEKDPGVRHLISAASEESTEL
jgi:hypothetical protein